MMSSEKSDQFINRNGRFRRFWAVRMG